MLSLRAFNVDQGLRQSGLAVRVLALAYSKSRSITCIRAKLYRLVIVVTNCVTTGKS